MIESDFLTIRQIATVAKQAGMRHNTMKAWRERAKHQRWHELGENIYRIIDGEPAYHVSVLSERMRRLVRPSKPDMEAIKARRALDMQAARKAVLDAIEARAKDAGRSWREAAMEFVAAVDAVAKMRAASGRQITGFGLPYTILREAKEWTPKGRSWTVSRATLYQWRRDASGPATAPPRPRTTGAAGSFEKGFRAASEFIWTSPDVTLERLVMYDEARFIEALRRRGYRVERVQSEPVQSGS